MQLTPGVSRPVFVEVDAPWPPGAECCPLRTLGPGVCPRREDSPISLLGSGWNPEAPLCSISFSHYCGRLACYPHSNLYLPSMFAPPPPHPIFPLKPLFSGENIPVPSHHFLEQLLYPPMSAESQLAPTLSLGPSQEGVGGPRSQEDMASPVIHLCT